MHGFKLCSRLENLCRSVIHFVNLIDANVDTGEINEPIFTSEIKERIDAEDRTSDVIENGVNQMVMHSDKDMNNVHSSW